MSLKRAIYLRVFRSGQQQSHGNKSHGRLTKTEQLWGIIVLKTLETAGPFSRLVYFKRSTTNHTMIFVREYFWMTFIEQTLTTNIKLQTSGCQNSESNCHFFNTWLNNWTLFTQYWAETVSFVFRPYEALIPSHLFFKLNLCFERMCK